jgi:hypothetical protein
VGIQPVSFLVCREAEHRIGAFEHTVRFVRRIQIRISTPQTDGKKLGNPIEDQTTSVAYRNSPWQRRCHLSTEP